jgi:PhzF family phenazine biosynthesis protein
MPALFQVNAFTDAPFSGNPATVCLLDEAREAGWMQAVAAEMNLSETAFVRPLPEGFELRWFTPTTEVNLCGHATLASASCSATSSSGYAAPRSRHVPSPTGR